MMKIKKLKISRRKMANNDSFAESYKPIVAEAAKKSADKIYNRIMVTHLLMDENNENRVGGAVGFNMRTGDYHIFKAKQLVAAGGASHF